MKDHSRKLLDKAVDAIEAAEMLVDNEKPEFAAGRAYYAMFYIAEALLNEKGLKFSKHSAVHAAFGNSLPRRKKWMLNSIVGCWIHSTKDRLAITMSIQKLKRMSP